MFERQQLRSVELVIVVMRANTLLVVAYSIYLYMYIPAAFIYIVAILLSTNFNDCNVTVLIFITACEF